MQVLFGELCDSKISINPVRLRIQVSIVSKSNFAVQIKFSERARLQNDLNIR